MLCLWLNFVCRLLRAHGGNLQASKAFLMYYISCYNVCWLEHITFALNANVLKTLFLAKMEWLLSQFRYWSVCVGFLYAITNKVLSEPRETRVSRKGKAPSWFGSSVVNCMCGSCELMCCDVIFLWAACWCYMAYCNIVIIV